MKKANFLASKFDWTTELPFGERTRQIEKIFVDLTDWPVIWWLDSYDGLYTRGILCY